MWTGRKREEASRAEATQLARNRTQSTHTHTHPTTQDNQARRRPGAPTTGVLLPHVGSARDAHSDDTGATPDDRRATTAGTACERTIPLDAAGAGANEGNDGGGNGSRASVDGRIRGIDDARATLVPVAVHSPAPWLGARIGVVSSEAEPQSGRPSDETLPEEDVDDADDGTEGARPASAASGRVGAARSGRRIEPPTLELRWNVTGTAAEPTRFHGFAGRSAESTSGAVEAVGGTGAKEEANGAPGCRPALVNVASDPPLDSRKSGTPADRRRSWSAATTASIDGAGDVGRGGGGGGVGRAGVEASSNTRLRP